MNTKKLSAWVTAALFCLFIFGFGILHVLTPDKGFSPVENRSLAQRPDFTWQSLVDGKYIPALEKYMADQFPFRDSWMGLESRYSWLMGHREFNGVFLAGDALISQVSDERRVDKNLAAVSSLVEKTDKPVYLGLIPTAAEVWRDKLPSGAYSMDQLALLERAKETGAIWVDMGGALTAHKDEYIYYRTDHHWTSLGAYYGYAAFMEAQGREPAPLGHMTTVSEDFNGTLYSSSGIHWLEPDRIDRYVSSEGITVEDPIKKVEHGLYVDSFLQEKDKYSSFMGGNTPLYVVKDPNAATDKKLLVIRDSFSDSLAPFLAQEYSEIHLLDLRYYKTPVSKYAEDNGMDEIFICYSVDNFAKDIDALFIGR